MSKTYLRKNRIGRQFAARPIEMLESPAYRVLSHAAHRVLSRIEIELAHHAGLENGKLPVTFDHFAEYGVRRHSIAPAIQELEALGLIEVTEQGRAGNGEWRRPNKFRLTYRNVDRASPTDEWKRIKSDEEAKMTARASHRHLRNPTKTPARKTESQCTVRPNFSVQNGTENPIFHSDDSYTTAVVTKRTLPLESRVGEGDRGDSPASILRQHRTRLLASTAPAYWPGQLSEILEGPARLQPLASFNAAHDATELPRLRVVDGGRR